MTFISNIVNTNIPLPFTDCVGLPKLLHCIQGGPAKVRPTYIFAGTWMCR